MANVENRSRYTVTVKNNAVLTRLQLPLAPSSTHYRCNSLPSRKRQERPELDEALRHQGVPQPRATRIHANPASRQGVPSKFDFPLQMRRLRNHRP
ncbi:hypothetical protein D9M68_265140 [compost metagenome]